VGVNVGSNRFKGLVDAENAKDFKEKLGDLKER